MNALRFGLTTFTGPKSTYGPSFQSFKINVDKTNEREFTELSESGDEVTLTLTGGTPHESFLMGALRTQLLGDGIKEAPKVSSDTLPYDLVTQGFIGSLTNVSSSS